MTRIAGKKTKQIAVIHTIAILQRKVQITFVQHLKRGECWRPHRRELREGSNTSVAQASRWTGHATEQNTHNTGVAEKKHTQHRCKRTKQSQHMRSSTKHTQNMCNRPKHTQRMYSSNTEHSTIIPWAHP